MFKSPQLSYLEHTLLSSQTFSCGTGLDSLTRNPYAFLSNDVSHTQATQAIGKYSQRLHVTRDLEQGSMGHGVGGWAVSRGEKEKGKQRTEVRANHCVAGSKESHTLYVSRRKRYMVTVGEATQSCMWLPSARG